MEPVVMRSAPTPKCSLTTSSPYLMHTKDQCQTVNSEQCCTDEVRVFFLVDVALQSFLTSHPRQASTPSNITFAQRYHADFINDSEALNAALHQDHSLPAQKHDCACRGAAPAASCGPARKSYKGIHQPGERNYSVRQSLLQCPALHLSAVEE